MAPATKDERYAARSILATSETSGLKFAAVAAILWDAARPLLDGDASPPREPRKEFSK